MLAAVRPNKIEDGSRLASSRRRGQATNIFQSSNLPVAGAVPTAKTLFSVNFKTVG